MHAVHCLRAETDPDNFCCSHRCTSYVRLGQGRVRVTSTGASRYFNCYASFSPCDRPCPSNVRPCTSAPSLSHSRTKGERTFHLPTVSAASEQPSLASNDEGCRCQCPIASRPGSSNKSSSGYSSTPLDLSSGKSDALRPGSNCHAHNCREYLNSRLNRASCDRFQWCIGENGGNKTAALQTDMSDRNCPYRSWGKGVGDRRSRFPELRCSLRKTTGDIRSRAELRKYRAFGFSRKPSG